MTESEGINPELLEPDCSEKAKKKYFASEKGKDALKKYSQTEKGKEARKKYCESEKFKLAERKYYYSEKGKASFDKVAKKNNLYKEAQKWLRRNPGKVFDDFLKEKGLLIEGGANGQTEKSESPSDSGTETRPETTS